MTPLEMKARSDRLGESLGSSAMLRVGREYRESHIAARFAERRGAQAVKLLHERPRQPTPDFALLVEGVELRFEATEADIPGRRRQDEYRQPPRVDPMIFTTLDVMVEQMRKLASAKVRKVYDSCHGLVIWVNPPAFSFVPSLRWERLVRGAEPAAPAFREVWVMRGPGSLVWLDGVAQREIPGQDF